VSIRTTYKKGLTIPEHIKNQIPRSLITILEDDAYGISFNSKISAQMRYCFLKQDYGGSYPLSAFAGWETLLLSAMAAYNKLAKAMPNGGRYCSPNKGVRFNEKAPKGKKYLEYSWQVHYKKNNKSAFKSLYCGNENTMTTERKRHAELTAWHFRKLYCEDGDPGVFSPENTKNWQNEALYKKANN
jgi:hypothetical protein